MKKTGKLKIGDDGRRWVFTATSGQLAGKRALAYIDREGKPRLYTSDGRVGGKGRRASE